jgi:hypothetical protein
MCQLFWKRQAWLWLSRVRGFADVALLLAAAGDTITFAEIAGWLREAGFAKARLLEASAPQIPMTLE